MVQAGGLESRIDDWTRDIMTDLNHLKEAIIHFDSTFAFIWYEMTMSSATDSKPSSTRRSTAEQTMMTV